MIGLPAKRRAEKAATGRLRLLSIVLLSAVAAATVVGTVGGGADTGGYWGVGTRSGGRATTPGTWGSIARGLGSGTEASSPVVPTNPTVPAPPVIPNGPTLI